MGQTSLKVSNLKPGRSQKPDPEQKSPQQAPADPCEDAAAVGRDQIGKGKDKAFNTNLQTKPLSCEAAQCCPACRVPTSSAELGSATRGLGPVRGWQGLRTPKTHQKWGLPLTAKEENIALPIQNTSPADRRPPTDHTQWLPTPASEALIHSHHFHLALTHPLLPQCPPSRAWSTGYHGFQPATQRDE